MYFLKKSEPQRHDKSDASPRMRPHPGVKWVTSARVRAQIGRSLGSVMDGLWMDAVYSRGGREMGGSRVKCGRYFARWWWI